MYALFEQYGGGEGDSVANPISMIIIIPHGLGDEVHLIEVGVEPEERKVVVEKGI